MSNNKIPVSVTVSQKAIDNCKKIAEVTGLNFSQVVSSFMENGTVKVSVKPIKGVKK